MLIETHYLPSLFVIVASYRDGFLEIETRENYQKRSFRNRAIIWGPNGKQTLNVPLKKGKHQQCSIREVEIAYYENWPKQHCQALKSAYGSTPYFEYYFPGIENILSGRYKFLIDLNDHLLRFFLRRIKLNLPLSCSTVYRHEYKFRDLRNSILPKSDVPSFWSDSYAQYYRVKHPLISVIEPLFHLGPETILYIEQLAKEYQQLID